MPRIRTIKPEFWASRSLSKVDFFSRLLFIALWNFADDEGRGRAIAKEVNGFAFPLDDGVTVKEIDRGLRQLEQVGCIRLYEHDGQRYFDIPSWSAHQVINRATISKLPSFEDSVSTHGVDSDDSLPRARGREVEMEVGNGKGKGGAASPPRVSKFVKPEPKEVADYFVECGAKRSQAKAFYDHYEANGWMVGRVPMKNWKASISGWIGRQPQFSNGSAAAKEEPEYEGPTAEEAAAELEERKERIRKGLEENAAVIEAGRASRRGLASVPTT